MTASKKKAAPAKKAPAKKAAPRKKVEVKKTITGIAPPNPEIVKREFPNLMSMDEADTAIIEEIIATAPVTKPISVPLKLTGTEKEKALKAALIDSNRVIGNFMKLLNMHDRRHESFKQIDSNNELLK